MSKSTAGKTIVATTVWSVHSVYGKYQVALRADGTYFSREYGFNGYGQGWGKWTIDNDTCTDDLRDCDILEGSRCRLPSYSVIPTLADREESKQARIAANEASEEKKRKERETFTVNVDIHKTGSFSVRLFCNETIDSIGSKIHEIAGYPFKIISDYDGREVTL